jgi:hypothetical protein
MLPIGLWLVIHFNITIPSDFVAGKTRLIARINPPFLMLPYLMSLVSPKLSYRSHLHASILVLRVSAQLHLHVR